MNLIDVVRYYRRHAYLDKDAYGCLLFALQLPSICSRIKKRAGFEEYVDLDTDKKEYIKWLCEHRNSFGVFFNELLYNDRMWKKFCKSIYKLRCMVVHEGAFVRISGKSTSDYTFYFVEDAPSAIIGKCVFTSTPVFCSCFFEAALETFKDPKLNDYLNVTPYETMFFPNMVYNSLSAGAYDHYLSFWKEHSDVDKVLNCIYDHLCSCKKGRMILDEMKEHFSDQQDAPYKYRKSKTDNRDVCIMLNPNKWIIREKRYKPGCIVEDLTVANFVLSYDDYQRMIAIHDALCEFVNKNPFGLSRSDVEKQLKEFFE